MKVQYKVNGKPVIFIPQKMPLPAASEWFTSISCWYRFSQWLKTLCWVLKQFTMACWMLIKSTEDLIELSRQYGLDIDPTALVHDLPVGIQQRVEIIKALIPQSRDIDSG